MKHIDATKVIYIYTRGRRHLKYYFSEQTH